MSTPAAVVAVVVAFAFGCLVTWRLLRRYEALPASTASYNCPTQTISVDFGSPPGEELLIYAHVWTGSFTLSDAPPPEAIRFICPAGTNPFTMFHSGWPNAGTVDFCVWVVASSQFTQTTGSQDCNGSGAGTVLAESARTLRSQVADTTPRMWTVCLQGFSPASLRAFNGLFQLQVVTRDTPTWSSNGDGVQTPRVELCSERLAGTPWFLLLTLGGVCIRYRATTWRALAENTLYLESTEGVADRANLPDVVVVQPA